MGIQNVLNIFKGKSSCKCVNIPSVCYHPHSQKIGKLWSLCLRFHEEYLLPSKIKKCNEANNKHFFLVKYS